VWEEYAFSSVPAPPTLLADAQLSDYRAYEGRKLKKLRYYLTAER